MAKLETFDWITCLVGKTKLGGGFKYVLFSPRFLGEMIQFDEHIFQMGGSTTN